MKIYHMPDSLLINIVRRCTFGLQPLVFNTTNAFTGFERRTQPTAMRWEMSVQLVQSERNFWAEFEAFNSLVQMESAFFTALDPGNNVPRGKPLTNLLAGECVDYDNNVEFQGASGFQVTGDRISVASAATRGETNLQLQKLLGRSRVFEANDLFSILHGANNIPMLYKVLQPVLSDGTAGVRDGEATLKIAPGLRYPVAVGDEIVVYRPRSVFQFSRDPTSSRQAPLVSSMAFRAIEVPEVIDIMDIQVQ